MTRTTPALSIDGQKRSTIYVMVWAMLALLALGYLTLLAIRPDLAASMVVNPPFGTPEGNQGQRAMFKALAEVQELKKTVTKLQSELTELRTAVVADRQRMLELEGRIAAAEARAKAAVPVADASPASQKTAAAPAVEAGDTLAGNAVRGQVIEGPQKNSRDTKALPKTIASVAGPTADSTAPASEPAPAKSMGLLISSGPSLDALRLTWQLLLESNRSTLRSLEPRFIETPGNPPAYQLIAGPIGSREAAAKACERLKAKQARCQVTSFAGQAL